MGRIIRQLIVVFVLSSNLIVFQNCSSGLKSSTPSAVSTSASAVSCTNAGISYNLGATIQTYSVAAATYPSLCAQVTRTCLASGVFDGPIVSSCVQSCVFPGDGVAVAAGPANYYSTSSGPTCTPVAVTCVQSTGLFNVTLPPTAVSSCVVTGQACSYVNGAGTATPNGYSVGSTVTGFTSQSATYPNLCTNVTSACQSSGSWTNGAPLYTSCNQSCSLNGTTFVQGIYHLYSSGTAAQCASTTTCGANGQFSPAVTGTSVFGQCASIAPPVISSFGPSQTIAIGGTATLSWVISSASGYPVTMTISNGQTTTTVTGTSFATPALTASTTYTLSVSNSVSGVVQTSTATATITVGSITGQYTLPADRAAIWNPGMMSKGGIPNRTTICSTLSPSGGDDSAAIQAKLDSCPAGQVVQLNAGTFNVNSSYLLIHSSITLRGAGAGVTILNKSNGAKPRTLSVVAGTNGILTPVDPSTYTPDTQPIVILGPSRWPKSDSFQNLTADAQQGSFSVTIASASGYSVGQFVLLDETSGASWMPVPFGFGCTDSILAAPCPPQVWQGDKVAWNMHYPTQQYQDDNGNSNTAGPFDTTAGVAPAAMSWFSRQDRPTSEIKEIASVSGNAITFTTPISINYRISHNAQLTQYLGANAQVTNAGIENLTTQGGADGEVRFENAAYSWAKNIEVTQWIGEGIAINNSFRVEVRDSYIHTGSWPQPGGAGYIISFADGSSEVLIENNILIDACKEMVFRSSGAASVVAYNFADDSWDFDNPTWVEVGLNASHMAGPHHVLFEGNYSQNADSDYTHGNAIYLTFYRNWLSGQRRSFTDSANVRTVGLAYGSWWDSFVGNVLGRSGQMAGWSYTDSAMSCDSSGNNCTGNNGTWGDKDIWKIGYDPERWSMQPDSKTLSTTIRDGNYDFVTNSQKWHNSSSGLSLPNSLYLKAKPAFFGSNTWPWTDPSSGKIYTLPAKARYEAGTPNIVH